MLKIHVNVKGSLNAENITQMVFGAKNTSASEVQNAKLYYTADVNAFNTTNLLSTISTGPTGNA